jgi:hypothetical protein
MSAFIWNQAAQLAADMAREIMSRGHIFDTDQEQAQRRARARVAEELADLFRLKAQEPDDR